MKVFSGRNAGEPISILVSLDVTTLNESLHVLAVLPTLAPYRLVLAVAFAASWL
jgi:hypothetical protein